MPRATCLPVPVVLVILLLAVATSGAGPSSTAPDPLRLAPARGDTSSQDALLQITSLLDPDWVGTGGTSSRYGFAVSTVGDVNGDGYSDALVGDPNFANGTLGEGAVFLYFGSATGLSTSPDWSYEPNQSAQLGWSVSPAGDTNGDGYADFLVGAPDLSSGEVQEGRVYLFAGGPSTPTLLSTFEMNDEEARFGRSVSWAGDVNGDGYDDILAGAPVWGGFGSPFYIPVQGAARLYFGGPGGPDQTADWSVLGGQEFMSFGYSVAGIGDVNADGYNDILVGAPEYDPGIFDTNQGIVRCYLGSPTGPSTSPDWEVVGPWTSGRLGSCVSSAGDVDGDGYADALMSARFADGASGKIYVSHGSAGGLSPMHDITPATDSYQAGISLATAGDVNGDGFADVIIGSGDATAWLLTGHTTGLAFAGALPGIHLFGSAVGTAGDVNGDGLGDYFIGSYFEDAAYVYHGERDETPLLVHLGNFLGTGVGDLFASSVASAGDVDGDGHDDLIVGTPRTDTPSPGRAEIFLGSESGIGDGSDWTVTGSSNSRFGQDVARAGDVNGDGFADVVVGEPGANRVHVYHGSNTGPATTAAWSFTFGDDPTADFGAAVAGAGDVNGDGYADIVVGAPLYDDASGDEGLIRVFFGSSTGIRSSGYSERIGPQAGAQFGRAVAGAGDANGDGFDDVAVGAPEWANGISTGAGAAYVYWGSATGLAPGNWQEEAVEAGNHFGASLAGAGDVNGDGYADLVLGTPDWDQTGYATVLFGGEPAYENFEAFYFLVSQYGRSVDTAGDVNGDGRSDVLVGSIDGNQARLDILSYQDGAFGVYETILRTEDATDLVVATAGDITGDGFPEVALGMPRATGLDRGKLYLVAVNEHSLAHGFPAALPRLTATLGDPVALRGRVQDSGDLVFNARGASPAGRTLVRVAWQLTSVGQPYDPPEYGPWADSGSVGGAPPELSDGLGFSLLEGARYTWRLRVATANPFFPHGRWMTNEPGAASLYGFAVGSIATPVEEIADSTTPPRLFFERIGPNPFGSSTEIVLAMPKAGPLRTRVFDVRGRVVATLADGVREAGRHVFRWNGKADNGQQVAAGVYFLRVETAGESASRKLILIP